MYDYIFTDYPLPIEKYIPKKYKELIHYSVAADGFQTKDLDCTLSSYYISNDGKIFLDIFDFSSDKQLERKPMYYHGHIKMHTMIYLDDSNEEEWHRNTATNARRWLPKELYMA